MKYHPAHPMAGDNLEELALEKEEVDKAFARPDINFHGQLISPFISA